MRFNLLECDPISFPCEPPVSKRKAGGTRGPTYHLLLLLTGSPMNGQETRPSIGERLAQANGSIEVFVDSRLTSHRNLETGGHRPDNICQEI